MADSKTYPLTDPAALAAKVKAEGGPALDPTRPTGQASADGVTMGWSIADGSITLTIIKKPWIIPASTIWSHADALFA
ncbi:hypothetical protein [Pseudomonas sp.]|uniref:hypothetical protein n=1 Tax=Pseudomonas sp. TaxID=306 RepID=UPI0026079DD8|nr:hypothetical protein [Pseudomonas sp.]